MTALPVMPHEVRDWTVDDLDLVPDDGLQYELLDGMLLVTPAPIVGHQRAAARLHLLLAAGLPAGSEGPVRPPRLAPGPADVAATRCAGRSNRPTSTQHQPIDDPCR